MVMSKKWLLRTSLTFLSSLSEWVPLSPTLQPLIVLILPEEPELDVLRLLMGLEAGAIDSEGPEHIIGEDMSLFSGLCLTKSFFIRSKGVGFFILLLISVCICSYFCLISKSWSCFSLKDNWTSFRFFHSSTSFSTWAMEWTLFLKSFIISMSSFCTLSSIISGLLLFFVLFASELSSLFIFCWYSNWEYVGLKSELADTKTYVVLFYNSRINLNDFTYLEYSLSYILLTEEAIHR